MLSKECASKQVRVYDIHEHECKLLVIIKACKFGRHLKLDCNV